MSQKYYGAKVKCLDCWDVIQSKHVHDWVCCSCFNDDSKLTGIFIDGGGEYCRMGCKEKSQWEQIESCKYVIED